MDWTDILTYLCLAFYGLATVASLIGLLGRSPRAKKLAVMFCTTLLVRQRMSGRLLRRVSNTVAALLLRPFIINLLPLEWDFQPRR